MAGRAGGEMKCLCTLLLDLALSVLLTYALDVCMAAAAYTSWRSSTYSLFHSPLYKTCNHEETSLCCSIATTCNKHKLSSRKRCTTPRSPCLSDEPLPSSSRDGFMHGQINLSLNFRGVSNARSHLVCELTSTLKTTMSSTECCPWANATSTLVQSCGNEAKL